MTLLEKVKKSNSNLGTEEIIDAYCPSDFKLRDRCEEGNCEKCWNRPYIEDSINSPTHYTDGKIEVIDYIEDKKLGFCLGNAIKYISRAGKKDPTKEVEDLKKAIWYLERRIKELEEL